MYGFSIASEKPGSFYLVYKHPQARVKSETITVQPDGFLFRMRKFRDVDSLLRFFKEDELKALQRKMQDKRVPNPTSDSSRHHNAQRDGSRDSSRNGRNANQGVHPSRAAMLDPSGRFDKK